MTIFDRDYEASVAYLESVLQPGMDIAVFMFRYFIVRTKIDVWPEFQLQLKNLGFMSLLLPWMFLFLNSAGIKAC